MIDDNGVLVVPSRPVANPIDRVKWAKARRVVITYCYCDANGECVDVEEVVVKDNGSAK